MANLDVTHLFVYGSLRSGFKSPAYEYISRHFNLVGEARVKGILYDPGDYPAAKPFDGDRYIIGELYEARHPAEFDWAIGQLDDYEGVTAEPGEQTQYTRALTDVISNEKKYTAWVYWYTGDVSGKPEVLSGDVLDYARQKDTRR